MKIKTQLLKNQFQQLHEAHRELLCELKAYSGLCPSSFIESLRKNLSHIERLQRRFLIDGFTGDMDLAIMTLKQKEYKEGLSRVKRLCKKALVMRTKHGKIASKRSVDIATVAT